MGADIDSADAAQPEGTIGQLRSFWGFQNGEGYEFLLLDNEEE